VAGNIPKEIIMTMSVTLGKVSKETKDNVGSAHFDATLGCVTKNATLNRCPNG
jgi:hypothetical protein